MELGTVLAVIAFADQCLKYGNKFVKRCKNYLHAEEEATELLVAIECNWVKMETQIVFLKRVVPELNKEIQDMQSQILSQLEGKLKTASFVIEQLVKEKKEFEKGSDKKETWVHDERDIATKLKDVGGMKRTKKAKYAIKKDALFKILKDVEAWQQRYDPSWILIMNLSRSSIDDKLNEEERKPVGDQIPIIMAAKGIRDAVRASQEVKIRDQASVWLDADDLDLVPLCIPNSTVQIATLDDERDMVLIDTMLSNAAANINSTTKEVRNLARILAEVDPSTFGLLKCRGVMRVSRESMALQTLTDFKFIFNIPQQLSSPQSLRGLLLSETSYPLDERLDLAKKITSSILFVHTVNFVHKNIRPETIIVFKNDASSIGAPFLAGFEQFRLEDGNTFRSGDDLWQHNLYRHPTRQGLHPEVDYQMQHDIYSLGVVLLEIGLWISFIRLGLNKEKEKKPTSSPIDPEHPGFPLPNSVLNPRTLEKSRNPLGSAAENKQRLENLAQTELPARLGKRYTEIVLLCLRCIDPGIGTSQDGKGFGVTGEDYVDEDGFVIGVRFIENVLEKMLEITI